MGTHLYYDLDVGHFVDKIGYKNLKKDLVIQRAVSESLSITFLRKSKPVKFAGDNVQVGFVLKPKVNFDADPIASVDLLWDDEHEHYSGELILNTEPIVDLFKSDMACLEVIGGAGWVLNDDDSINPTNTLCVTLLNTAYTGTEPAPTPVPSAETWLTNRAVRFDLSQSLIGTQRWQAMQNLGFSIGTDPILGTNLRFTLADGTILQFTANVVTA